MLKIRPLIITPQYEVLGGNMRLRAMRELGMKKAPVIIVDLPKELQDQFIIKDNIGYGEWDLDLLYEYYDKTEVVEWGMDLPLEDWDNFEDIDYDGEAPPPVVKNKVCIIIPPKAMDSMEEIRDFITTIIAEKYPDCEVK